MVETRSRKAALRSERFPNAFLRTIVEVVTKGRSDLGLKFHHGHKLIANFDNQVPLLFSPEPSGQFDAQSFTEETCFCNSGLGQKPAEQINEAVHLFATGHGDAVASVFLGRQQPFFWIVSHA